MAMGTRHRGRLGRIAAHVAATATSAATLEVSPELDEPALALPDSGRALSTAEKQELFENGCELRRTRLLVSIILLRLARRRFSQRSSGCLTR
jgi:hypothetical protein